MACKKMKKLVDRLLVIYPFEKSFYDNAGIPVTYVGHPLLMKFIKGVDEGLVTELKKQLGETIVSFLPGSRRQGNRSIITFVPAISGTDTSNNPLGTISHLLQQRATF